MRSRPRARGSGLVFEDDLRPGKQDGRAGRRSSSRVRSSDSTELPLSEAFWTWAVTIGLVVNVTTTVLFLVLIMHDQPWAAALFGYALSVPYNIAAAVEVWRSAARYQGPNVHAELARGVRLLLMVILSLT